MQHWWYHKPYKPFFLTGLATTILALIYLIIYPESEFDLSIYDYFVVSSYTLWLCFSAYIFFLSIVYFSATRLKLHTRKWLVIPHYIFILLFLFSLLTFSLFNVSVAKSLFASLPFGLLVSLYGTLFLTDIVLFVISMILLLANLAALRRDQ